MLLSTRDVVVACFWRVHHCASEQPVCLDLPEPAVVGSVHTLQIDQRFAIPSYPMMLVRAERLQRIVGSSQTQGIIYYFVDTRQVAENEEMLSIELHWFLMHNISRISQFNSFRFTSPCAIFSLRSLV